MQRELNKDWYEGIYELQKAVMIVYVRLLHQEELATRIWEGIMKYHMTEAGYWLVFVILDCHRQDYIQFDRLYCQGIHTHDLFRRACASSLDQTEYLISLWEDFERTQGTLESWNEFLRRSSRYREAAAQREAAQQKRDIPTEESQAEPSKRVCVTTSQTKKNLKEKKRDAAVQRRTVFVNNIPFTATEADLQTLFASYGSIASINVVRNNHGKSRGFAYVEFEEEQSASNAIEQNGKELQHRKLEVKLSVPQDERKMEKKETHSTVSATIYVSGLPTGVSEYEFSVFFSKVGMWGEFNSSVEKSSVHE